jgi:hypothetical protein
MRKPAGQSNAAQARRGWDENTAALKWIADTARQSGLPLAVAVLPHSWVSEAELRLNALDSHPNEKYNAIVADLLTAYFVSPI